MSSTRKKTKQKLPLTLRADGRYCKRINGEIKYFGRDLECALDAYHALLRQMEGGPVPTAPTVATAPAVLFTVNDLVRSFLDEKTALDGHDKLAALTLDNYSKVCEQLERHLGSQTALQTLTGDDLKELRKKLAKGKRWSLSPSSLDQLLIVVRMVFGHGAKGKMINVDFAEALEGSTSTAKRKARKKRLLTRDQIHAMLNVADDQYKSIILFGINCAFGNSDIARLEKTHIKGQWVEHPRPKTGVERRCHLWPETLAALEVMRRPSAAKREHDRLVFLTAEGLPWVSPTERDENHISIEWARLAKLGGVPSGLGFYSLRRAFETYAAIAAPAHVVSAIMGHTDDSMAAVYRQGIPNSMFRTASDYVRSWLFREIDDPFSNCE